MLTSIEICSQFVYQFSRMCSSRKYPYPPDGRSLKIPRGGGSQTPKCLKESMGLNWNFWRGGGSQTKTLPGEGYGYFMEQHNQLLDCCFYFIIFIQEKMLTSSFMKLLLKMS